MSRAKRLTQSEFITIKQLTEKKLTTSQIAKVLGRSDSVIRAARKQSTWESYLEFNEQKLARWKETLEKREKESAKEPEQVEYYPLFEDTPEPRTGNTQLEVLREILAELKALNAKWA